MLLVRTKAGPSPIHGTGVFAEEFIPKGTEVWRFVVGKDAAYTKAEVERLPEPKRSEILGLHFAYISTQTGRHIDPDDDAKYMNHSSTPNVGSKFVEGVEEDVGFTLRDIEKGEELTIDYNGFAQEGADF